MPIRYFEDYEIGQEFTAGPYEVTAEEIIDFATKYDPQYFHTDPEAAKDSVYGGLIASGWHSCGIAMRLMLEAYLKDHVGQGSPGVEEIRWKLPVRPGDRLTLHSRIIDMRPSASREDRGIVQGAHSLRNQDGQEVMSYVGTGFYGRRPR